ncbi:uncharacterized protein SOCE26_092110 [Sorangium cellulosum]|uniref:MalT-like TPR region domain-containing protein n=1 Tax=Sorangium cellulosum TaxID=56 RepID=A0A2L0F842_SORCE|nr:hypothetical protein [Sorangium cellulosum]AUX47687.1 uncharacterized protein SOCE26_092110 [Sorangium cellulosum]
MRSLEPQAAWTLLHEAIRRRAPLVVLAPGGAAPLAAAWRGAAREAGVAWIEAPGVDASAPRPGEPFGFWLDCAGALDPARPRASWLEPVRRVYSDPCGPMLPDGNAVAFALLGQLSPLLRGPSVLALRGLERATDDDLVVLGFLARALGAAGVVLVVFDEAPRDDAGIERRLSRAGDLPLARIDAPAASPRPAPPPYRGPEGEAAGVALCAAGALHAGVAALSEALAAAPEPHAPGRAEVWLHLAMAALQTHAPEVALRAARSARAAAAVPSVRRRARRVHMAALRQAGQAEALRELGLAAYAEREAAPDAAERWWLHLDAALGCSMLDPEGRHEVLLDVIVAGRDVPEGCRATAHLWKAAHVFVHGRGAASAATLVAERERAAEAAALQERGLAGLEAMGDVTRALFVRARLGATLEIAGRPADAIAHLEVAAERARWCGERALAALATAEAVTTCAALGERARAESLFARERAASSPGERAGEGPRRVLLERRARAHLAIARGAPREARREAEALLAEARGLPPQHAQAAFAECCEAVYLLADAAALEGDGEAARALAGAGLRLAADAGPEDRPRLCARGALRVARLVKWNVRAGDHPA